MATAEEIVQRLKESRPPATDNFTYLAILEKSLCPEILPALQDILEDAELTSEIGWDLVDMLIPVPGSAECLERVARLGNPREVIVKVLEAMDKTAAAAEKEQEHEDEEHGQLHTVDKFVALVGMLKILHGRLQVRAPSRFLHTTLDVVLRAYDARNPEATAAVIDFARSQSGQKRPLLPNRQSSTKLETPFQATDPALTAPDPEADPNDTPSPLESEIVARLLQSFITCVFEVYVNSNNMGWAARLLEHTNPERVVLRQGTMSQAYREVDELRSLDALAGQLVAVADDLGLTKISVEETRQMFKSVPCRDPLCEETDPGHPENIHLSTAGFTCLTAYWMFTADVFDAPNDHVQMDIFPDHHLLLEHLLGDDKQAAITANPGTFEALVVMAIYLDSHNGVFPASSITSQGAKNVMAYHHLLTLIAVFHPNILVRNAATTMAGAVLHADPDEISRLSILEDLMENCIFPSLKACAVTWLREEMISARKAGSKGVFVSSDCFEKLQYTVFPDLTYLSDAGTAMLWEFWTENSNYHLQVANFAIFIFGKDFENLAPAGMATAVEHRYAAPLLHAANVLSEALDKKDIEEPGAGPEASVQLDILTDTLQRVPFH